MVCRNIKVNYLGFSLVLSAIIMSGLLSSIIWSVWMLNSQIILEDSFSVPGKGLYSYHFYYPNAQLFQSSHVVICLGHSKIMWVIISLLDLHIRYLGSFLVPSIFVLMLSLLMHCFWALVISHSVCLFKWLFCNQFRDFMSAISSVSLVNWPWSLLYFQSSFLLVCNLCLVTYGGSVTSYSPDDLHAAGMCLSWLFWI